VIRNEELVSVPQLIEALGRTPAPEGGVLSVYLDTSPARVDGLAYLLSFQDGCRAIRAQLDASQSEAFDAAARRAEHFLRDGFMPGAPAVAIFAGADPDYFFAGRVRMTTPDQAAWDTRAHVGPLLAVLDELERVAVVLFDKERTRLLSIFLGEIEEVRSFEDEVPGKQATGDWFALAQTRYARHHEEHVLSHAKRTVLAIADLLRTHPFDRLLIGGPDEAVSILRGQLPRVLRRRVAGTISVEMFAPNADILKLALEAGENAERLQEANTVRDLIEGVGTGRVALGISPTLSALNNGRVHLLVLPTPSSGSVAECPECRHLGTVGESCPLCLGLLSRTGDLAELTMEIATLQGARVEQVRGEAAATLMRHGGIGALVRY